MASGTNAKHFDNGTKRSLSPIASRSPEGLDGPIPSVEQPTKAVASDSCSVVVHCSTHKTRDRGSMASHHPGNQPALRVGLITKVEFSNLSIAHCVGR